MADVQHLIIEAPKRRRKAQRYTEGELGTFAEAWPQVGENFALKVGEAATENDARTIARDAQRELKAAHGIDARTSVFAHGDMFVAALRHKSGESGGPGVGAGNAAATDAPGWNPAMVGTTPDSAA